jgi:hypothetical protein
VLPFVSNTYFRRYVDMYWQGPGDVGIHDPPAWYFVHRGSTLDVIPSSPDTTRAKDPSSCFQRFSELVSMSWL